jgi:hypothetical protein
MIFDILRGVFSGFSDSKTVEKNKEELKKIRDDLKKEKINYKDIVEISKKL